MRYRSVANSLGIYREDGKIKRDPTTQDPYRFFNGVLNVGTLTSTGSGNEIDPQLSATDGSSAMEIYPSAGTDLGKIGLDVLFIEAPPIAVPNTPTAGVAYEVISGSITYGGKTYQTGDVFYGVSGATALATGSTSASVALATDLKYRNIPCCDEEPALFNQQHTLNSEEAYFAYGATNGYNTLHTHGWTLQTL